MLAWLVGLLAKNSDYKTNIEVVPFKVLSKEIVEQLMNKIPFFWHNLSGKKRILVITMFTEYQDSNYNKNLVRTIIEKYPEYRIGLFFSDIPDPEERDKNFRSKAVVFYCKDQKSIKDFFDLENLSDYCPDEKYELLEKEIEKKGTLFYKLANINFYTLAFPVIILEDGRVYDLGFYKNFPIEDILSKILSQ
ncbi:MAG: hypothetical protein ACP5HC_02270 [Caldisericum sp.]